MSKMLLIPLKYPLFDLDIVLFQSFILFHYQYNILLTSYSYGKKATAVQYHNVVG